MEFLRKIYLFEVETEDSLYWFNMDKIFGEKEDGHDIETIETDNTSWGGEAAPMEIEEVMNILTDLKNMGATHIEMKYHSDHGNYIFNGVEMRKATDDEIQRYLDECSANRRSSKEQEIAFLEAKLKELKEE